MTTVRVTTVTSTTTHVELLTTTTRLSPAQFKVIATAQTCQLEPIDAMEFPAAVASTARVSAALVECAEISGMTGTMTSRTLFKHG